MGLPAAGSICSDGFRLPVFFFGFVVIGLK
jgi:hypothetical protein